MYCERTIMSRWRELVNTTKDEGGKLKGYEPAFMCRYCRGRLVYASHKHSLNVWETS